MSSYRQTLPCQKGARRRLLVASYGAASLGIFGSLGLVPCAHATLEVSNDRPYWRFCNKCQVMFYTQAADNRCAAGGKHVPQGYQFRLPFGGPETETAQRNWRACQQCQALFFAGSSKKGVCPVGGAHVAETTWLYVLPHDVAETPTAQKHWRFCNKCFAMFFNGSTNKGRCAAGDSHVAQGYNFVLPHSR